MYCKKKIGADIKSKEGRLVMMRFTVFPSNFVRFCFRAGYKCALKDLNEDVYIDIKHIDIDVIIRILKQTNGSEEFSTLLTRE